MRFRTPLHLVRRNGLLLIAAGGIPFATFRGSTWRLDAALVLFGAGRGPGAGEGGSE
jgi:hypothetical protein